MRPYCAVKGARHSFYTHRGPSAPFQAAVPWVYNRPATTLDRLLAMHHQPLTTSGHLVTGQPASVGEALMKMPDGEND